MLVDRLWPGGLKRDRAKIDHWLKHVAPTAELRRWFGHDPDRWAAFQERYRAELESNQAVPELRAMIAQHKRVTLLFAAKDAERNSAVVLQRSLAYR